MSTATLHPLRVERKRKNLSQRMLADFTGLGLSTIIRAERGEQLGAEARRRLSEYLQKSSEELGLVSKTEAQLDYQEITSVVIGEDLEDNMNRRQAIQALGFAGVAALFSTKQLLAAEPWDALSKALKKSSYLDDAAISNLEDITKSYWRLRANMSSHELVRGVSGHLETVTQLLRNGGAGHLQNRLYSLAGEVALIAGQIAFDMNDHTAARSYYRAAAEAASEVKNHALHCVALARTSFTYIDQDEPQNALILLGKAQILAHESGDPTISGWVNVIQAEAYANLRQLEPCRKALDVAEANVESGLSEDIYWTGFDTSRLFGYQGVCYVRLEQPQKAVAALQQTLSVACTKASRRRPRILTDMAIAYVQLGEIEEACHLATEALSLTRQTHNSMVAPRLQKFRQTVEPWRDSPVVQDFDAQLLLG